MAKHRGVAMKLGPYFRPMNWGTSGRSWKCLCFLAIDGRISRALSSSLYGDDKLGEKGSGSALWGTGGVRRENAAIVSRYNDCSIFVLGGRGMEREISVARTLLLVGIILPKFFSR